MKPRFLIQPFVAWLLAAVGMQAQMAPDPAVPHLERRGAVPQLVVDGQPFLAIAGELHNSSSSSLEYMKPIWPKLAAMHLNTVLLPVSWELIEPQEGRFDFSLVDGLVRDAREQNLKVVFLWFGSWKNMVSSYAPVWVRAHPERFACAIDSGGNRLPILSTFSEEACSADSRALAELMRHVHQVEAAQPRKTVLMVQVENETGLDFGTRDWSPAADKAFAAAVPQALMTELSKPADTSATELRRLWQASGSKSGGSWAEVFGSGPATNEIFMAWNYGQYIGRVIAAAKAAYPLPMYVNASVGRADGKLATYPSGGPVSYLTPVWRLAAPQLDWLSPDIYYGNFSAWCEKYTKAGNPLFIPEMGATAGDVTNVMAAIAQFDAIGCARFGIDGRIEGMSEYSDGLRILSQLAPLILERQGSEALAFGMVDDATPSRDLTMGRYVLKLEKVRLRNVVPENMSGNAGTGFTKGFALVVETGSDEYFVAGKNIQITFSPHPDADEIAAVASIDEGVFLNGKWRAERRLNGDEIMLSYKLSDLAAENQTGTGAQFGSGDISIYRIKLIHYAASRLHSR